jgi:hypothetical protein
LHPAHFKWSVQQQVYFALNQRRNKMATSIEKAIEKVKLLQKLAGNNPSQEEVLAALAAADRIMADYRITQAQVEAADTTKAEAFVRQKLVAQGNRAAWVETIIRACCNSYGCCFYIDTEFVSVPEELQEMLGKEHGSITRYVVCGKKSDCEIVEYTVAYLLKYARILSAAKSKGKGLAWGKSFLEGFSIGVQEKFNLLKEEERRNAVQSTALVILNNRVAEARNYMASAIKLRSAGRLTGSSRNADGRSAGISAGRNANINKGLKG